MTKTVEAIYADGVLKPVQPLGLAEQQRVRLTIEPVDGLARELGDAEYEAAFQQLLKGIEQMNFRLDGPLPSRDELHERR